MGGGSSVVGGKERRYYPETIFFGSAGLHEKRRRFTGENPRANSSECFLWGASD